MEPKLQMSKYFLRGKKIKGHAIPRLRTAILYPGSGWSTGREVEVVRLSDEPNRRYPLNGLFSTTCRFPLSNDPLLKHPRPQAELSDKVFSFEIALISVSPERHLQFIHPFLAPLFDIESHLFKKMEHGPIFDQHLCIETQEPLFLRQIGKVGEQL